jgi:hypothetical protein
MGDANTAEGAPRSATPRRNLRVVLRRLTDVEVEGSRSSRARGGAGLSSGRRDGRLPTAGRPRSPSASVGPVSAVEPRTEPFNPEQSRENFRGRVALVLMALLALLAIGIVAITVALVRPFDRETVGY